MEQDPYQLKSASRIAVYGVAGVGKSSAAARIGTALGLPVRRVDEEIGWLPARQYGEWQLRPQVEIRQKFAHPLLAIPGAIHDEELPNRA